MVARPATREAGEVHRDPAERWSAATTAATSGGGSPSRPRRTAPSPVSRWICSRTSDPAWPWSAAASRCSGRSCSTRSTSFPPTSATSTVLTNKTWMDAYRGAGRPEATYAIERMMDELATEVGVDPLEIREKNWIKHEEFPFTTVAGLEYDSGNYEAATADGQGRCSGTTSSAPSRSGAGRPATRSSSASASRPSPRCAASRRQPGARQPRLRRRRLGARERADARRPARSRSSPGPAPTARVTRRRSARSWPTGSACRSRTSRCCTATPRSPHRGLDTYGSRSLVVGGEALVRAADKVIEKAKPIAAHLLEANVRRHRVHGWPAQRPGHRPGGGASARSRLAAFARAQPARRRGAHASTPTRPSTR